MDALDAKKGKGNLPAGVLVHKTLRRILLRIAVNEEKGENIFPNLVFRAVGNTYL